MINLLTPKEVAKILKVDYQTVLEWIKLGRIKAYQIGRGFRISEIDLFDFLQNNQYKSYWKGKIKL